MGDSNTTRNLPEQIEHVEDDYPNGLHILCFCATLENCLKKLHHTQSLIFDALHCFEQEDMKGDRRYPNTLEKLTIFRETEDPFAEFFEIFQIVHKQQKFMLEKVRIKKKKIVMNLKSIRTWAKVSSMVLVTIFEAILIYSVMTAAVASPPVAATLAAAATFPMDSVGEWIGSILKKFENTMIGQEEEITSMQVRTFLALEGLNTIRVHVERVEVQIKSLLQIADSAIGVGAEAVKLGVADIKKKLKDFMKNVKELEEEANLCFRGL